MCANLSDDAAPRVGSRQRAPAQPPGDTALPAGHRLRPPTEADVSAILAVVAAADVAVLGAVDFTTEDVRDALAAPNQSPQRDHWLVEGPDGTLLGWGYLQNHYGGGTEDFDVYPHPDADPSVRAVLTDLLLSRIAERAAAAGRPSLLAATGVVVGDDTWLQVLLERDFAVVRRFSRMSVSLSLGRPYPQPPEGVSLRPFDPSSEQDWADWHRVRVASFAEHWGEQPTSVEVLRARLESESGQPYDRWWFADLDGQPVGVLQSSAQAYEQNQGWVRFLGVTAEARGRGIGRLLLEHALAAYATDGRTSAELGVDTANVTGALRLYESLGMGATFQANILQREVHASSL